MKKALRGDVNTARWL